MYWIISKDLTKNQSEKVVFLQSKLCQYALLPHILLLCASLMPEGLWKSQLITSVMAVERGVYVGGLWFICVYDDREHNSRIPPMPPHYREVFK